MISAILFNLEHYTGAHCCVTFNICCVRLIAVAKWPDRLDFPENMTSLCIPMFSARTVPVAISRARIMSVGRKLILARCSVCSGITDSLPSLVNGRNQGYGQRYTSYTTNATSTLYGTKLLAAPTTFIHPELLMRQQTFAMNIWSNPWSLNWRNKFSTQSSRSKLNVNKTKEKVKEVKETLGETVKELV